jgi:menaquinone-specific isochorismate synthase
VKSTTTRIIDGPLTSVDLVALGARTGQLWRGETLAFAGVGRVTELAVGRPSDGGAVSAALGALTGVNELADRPGTGPLALGAFPFDRTATGSLQVPELALVDDGSDRWLTRFGGTEVEAVDRILGALDAPIPAPAELVLEPARTASAWRDEVVAVARDRIVAGDLHKAVLARELQVRGNGPIDGVRLVERLAARFPLANCFAVDGFIGASPERLVSRSGRVVRACPLAGTAARHDDPSADQAQIDALRASTKDQDEHRITIEWLLSELLPFCSYVDAEPEPSVMTMANVHHLATTVEGMLSEPAASVRDLVGAVHPTPALGGAPQAAALALIEQIEGMDRGRYGAPVGWVDAAGNGDFAVGIRSAQLDGSAARVWAGVGVVGQSDPAAELVETQAKFRAVLGSLLS